MEAIVAQHLPEKADEFKFRMGVYRDLATRKFGSPDELRQHFGSTFTPAQAKNIWTKLQPKGGVANDEVDFISPATSQAIDGLLSIFIPEVRLPIKTGLGFVFILSYVESLPIFGQLVAAALDMTAAVLPIIAVNFQNFTPLVVGLIPIPYANLVGVAIGYVFSAFFLWMAILMGISRQQFGSAVEATAGLIPVIGPTAMNWVAKANFTAAKLNQRRKKVMESVSETLQLVSQIVDATLTPALQTLDTQAQQAAQKANEVATVANDVKDLAKGQIADLKQKAALARTVAGRKKLTRRTRKKTQWRRTRRSKTH